MSPRKLSQVIRTLRKTKGWTQDTLSRKSKVTRAYIAKLETGGKTNPSLTVLKRLAKALGVPVTALLE